MQQMRRGMIGANRRPARVIASTDPGRVRLLPEFPALDVEFVAEAVPAFGWKRMHLAPGEAVILETELPTERRYWNVQLNDELWNAVEYIYRQSSLNGHQARIDSDGRFRAVISLEDPGVHNWLDPGETLRGMLIGRWLGCSSHPVPTLTRVPLPELRKHLPADIPTITADERAAQLRARRIGGQLRRRW